MENLPDDIILIIIDLLYDMDTLYSMTQLNNYYYNIVITKYRPKLVRLKLFYKREYPKHVINLFSNIQEMSQLPELMYREEFFSPLGNINNLKISDVDYPIMTGIDDFHRLFISFKVTFKLTNINEKHKNLNMLVGSIFEIIITYHQRNYFDPNIWIISSNSNTYKLFCNNMPISSDLLKIKKLINGETIYDKYYEISIIR